MRGLKGCAGVVAVLLASAIAFGQGSSTSLQGTITDPSGSAIAGANILLVNDGSKIERTTNTDPRGEYRLLALPPGTYRLTVNFKGFSQYVQTGLQLLVKPFEEANLLRIADAYEQSTDWHRQRPPI